MWVSCVSLRGDREKKNKKTQTVRANEEVASVLSASCDFTDALGQY